MKYWISSFVFLFCGIQKSLAQTSVDLAERHDTTIVAFVNVTVVSMQDESVLPGQTVVIKGERIRSIGPVESLSVPPEATVIDGSDRYLIPGLADMHVHVRVPFADGPLYLNAGITTVLSLGTRAMDDDAKLQERERSRTPSFMGPTLYTVGSLFMGQETPDDAERIVREHVERGFDLIKVYRDMSPEAFARLHHTANRLGIRVTGHAQRKRGMQPMYTHKQDVAHIEEYLYAAFNPNTTGFKVAILACMFGLVPLFVTAVGWDVGALWRWVRKRRSSGPCPRFYSVRRWVRVFTGCAWLLFIGLVLCLPEPFAGMLAGNTAFITTVGVLVLLALSAAVVLTLKVRGVWHNDVATIWTRVSLVLFVGFAWTFVVGSGFLAGRTWRSTEAGLAHIARKTAAAGIWVTPNLVTLDYVKRQAGDEFFTLIERPEMRYLRPDTRNRWINNNPYRVPDAGAPVQIAIWHNYTNLMSRLVGELSRANVPLLAGSDAVGPPGVLPGSSLHEELCLLVQAGLTPYEALRTATVNAATYLDDEQEFGRIVAGFRADLVLLAGNPLDDIHHIQTRIGTMKRGRWFSANKLEAMLSQLAEERK
jgi:imidazolonepropionase-like amidohydrolase